MNTLTTNANRFTIVPLLQKTAVGTLTPGPQEAYSRLIVKSDFFVPEINRRSKNPCLWALYGTETEQSVEGRHLLGMEQSIDGCEKPVQHPPLSILTDVEGIQYPPKKVITMTQKVTAYTPEDCYAIRPEVDKTKLYDPIILTLERASALVCLMEDNGQDLEEGFTIGHSAIMHLLHGVSADLKAATHLMESWDFTKAGETH